MISRPGRLGVAVGAQVVLGVDGVEPGRGGRVAGRVAALLDLAGSPGRPPSRPQASSGKPPRQWPTISEWTGGGRREHRRQKLPSQSWLTPTAHRPWYRSLRSMAVAKGPGRRAARPQGPDSPTSDPDGRPQPPGPPRLRHPRDLRVRHRAAGTRGEVAARRARSRCRTPTPGSTAASVAARGAHPSLRPGRPASAPTIPTGRASCCCTASRSTSWSGRPAAVAHPRAALHLLQGRRAKVELALARGRRLYDKRHAIADRDADREAARETARAIGRGPRSRADASRLRAEFRTRDQPRLERPALLELRVRRAARALRVAGATSQTQGGDWLRLWSSRWEKRAVVSGATLKSRNKKQTPSLSSRWLLNK